MGSPEWREGAGALVPPGAAGTGEEAPQRPCEVQGGELRLLTLVTRQQEQRPRFRPSSVPFTAGDGAHTSRRYWALFAQRAVFVRGVLPARLNGVTGAQFVSAELGFPPFPHRHPHPDGLLTAHLLPSSGWWGFAYPRVWSQPSVEDDEP